MENRKERLFFKLFSIFVCSVIWCKYALIAQIPISRIHLILIPILNRKIKKNSIIKIAIFRRQKCDKNIRSNPKIISLIFGIAVYFYQWISVRNPENSCDSMLENERDLKKQKLGTIITQGLSNMTLISLFIFLLTNWFYDILFHKVTHFHSIWKFGSSLNLWKITANNIKSIFFNMYPVYIQLKLKSIKNTYITMI